MRPGSVIVATISSMWWGLVLDLAPMNRIRAVPNHSWVKNLPPTRRKTSSTAVVVAAVAAVVAVVIFGQSVGSHKPAASIPEHTRPEHTHGRAMIADSHSQT